MLNEECNYFIETWQKRHHKIVQKRDCHVKAIKYEPQPKQPTSPSRTEGKNEICLMLTCKNLQGTRENETAILQNSIWQVDRLGRH